MDIQSHADWRSCVKRLFGNDVALNDSTTYSFFRVAVEQQSGIQLPDSLIEFLGHLAARCAPQANFGEFRWLLLEGIEPAWRVHAELAADADEVDEEIAGESDERIMRVTHHRRRVPIAEFNGDVWICLDYAPTALGTFGQVIQVDPEGLSWFWLAPSFDQLLVDLANGRVLDPDQGSQD